MSAASSAPICPAIRRSRAILSAPSAIRTPSSVCRGAVILSLCGGPQMLLTRSVLYTAITRARELLIIVGNEETVAAMTRNDRRQRRYSGLKLRLEGKA